jgi:hypothetical protein
MISSLPTLDVVSAVLIKVSHNRDYEEQFSLDFCVTRLFL